MYDIPSHPYLFPVLASITAVYDLILPTVYDMPSHPYLFQVLTSIPAVYDLILPIVYEMPSHPYLFPVLASIPAVLTKFSLLCMTPLVTRTCSGCWGTADAESKVYSTENPELSESLSPLSPSPPVILE